MKYKVLLTGNNRSTIDDFFTYMTYTFECMSSSNNSDDITNHLRYMHPEVFVCCLGGEKTNDWKRLISAGKRMAEDNIPVVVIGDSSDCGQFTRLAPDLEVSVLTKPIPSQSIEREIVGILEDRKLAERNKAMQNSAADAMKAMESLLAGPDGKPTPTYKKKHILIVDDDSRVLKTLKEYLSDQYNVATALSGKVAMKFLDTRDTDLVLLDYEMPEENGAEVLSRIRANRKTKNLPVVFLTGVTEKGKIQEVLALKPQGYLLKPIDMGRLSATIRNILK